MGNLLKVFASRRMLTVLFLGFCSGLPLALTGGTLQAWMKDAGVDLATIGRFALVGLPYTAKFLWSPFLDNIPPPFWGRRRGWATVAQLGLVVSILAMSQMDPTTQIGGLISLALALAFFSASQDIVLDAFRTELLKNEELGAGAGVFVTGYRLAALVSGALALILADRLPWKSVYMIMGVLMSLSSLAVYFSPEPKVELTSVDTMSFRERFGAPFSEFFSREGAVEILLFVMIYKLPTLMATALTTVFLMEVGFTKTEIGAVTKVAGLIATIVGTLSGGALMMRLGTRRALWFFGVLQATAGLGFILISAVGKSVVVLTAVIIMENFMMGLGVAAIQGFMMATCSRQFTATQFALLSSITAVTRVVLLAQAGVLAERLGWTSYFIFSVLLAIPGLFLLARYDHWQSLKHHVMSRWEKAQGFAFLLGLIAIGSEPIWAWQNQRALGTHMAQAGAVLILCAVVFTVVRGRLWGRRLGNG